MTRSRLLSVLLVSLLLSLVAVRAQSPTFDVVSIKENTSGSGASSIGFQAGGRFEAVNEPLARLIAFAYATGIDLPRTQILGGPAWIDTERFDVHALGDQKASPQDRTAKVRSILSERFHLIVHTEMRDLPLYNLVRLRPSGSLGESLHPSDVDCAAAERDRVQPPAASPGQVPPCMKGFLGNQLTARGLTIGELATSMIARVVDRPVVDQTRLAGPYDCTVRWAADASSDQNLPTSIFTALEEQLGLKLEPARGSLEVLVIDYVERPSAN